MSHADKDVWVTIILFVGSFGFAENVNSLCGAIIQFYSGQFKCEEKFSMLTKRCVICCIFLVCMCLQLKILKYLS